MARCTSSTRVPMPYNVDQRGWFSWPNNVFTHLDSKRLTKPLGLHYQIEYKQGPNNRLANPLTLYPQSASSCSALSAVSPVWLQSVVASYDSDPSIYWLLMPQRCPISPSALVFSGTRTIYGWVQRLLSAGSFAASDTC